MIFFASLYHADELTHLHAAVTVIRTGCGKNESTVLFAANVLINMDWLCIMNIEIVSSFLVKSLRQNKNSNAEENVTYNLK